MLVDRLWRALLEEGGPSSNDLPPWSGSLAAGCPGLQQGQVLEEGGCRSCTALI